MQGRKQRTLERWKVRKGNTHFIKIHDSVGVIFWLNSIEFERVGCVWGVGLGVNPQIPDPRPIRVEFVFVFF